MLPNMLLTKQIYRPIKHSIFYMLPIMFATKQSHWVVKYTNFTNLLSAPQSIASLFVSFMSFHLFSI